MATTPAQNGPSPFEGARSHVEAALQARSELAALWNDFLASKPFSHRLVVTEPNAGRLEVNVQWPSAIRDSCEAAATRFVDSIVGAFDASVRAAISVASGEHPSLLSDVKMPMCDDHDDFLERSMQASLRHLRPDQLDLLHLFQPLGSAPLGPGVTAEVRCAMNHLAELMAARSDHRVGIWVHAASPQFRGIDGGDVVVQWRASEPGLLWESFMIAEVRGSETTSLSAVSSNPGVEFSPVFAVEPVPDDPDDTMGQRTAELIATAMEFVDAMQRSSQPSALLPGFEWIAQQIARGDRSPWGRVDVKRVPFRRQLRRALRRSGHGIATYVSAEGDSTMFVRSGGDIYARPVPSASPLPENMLVGSGAEHASLLAAGEWGMPDFVMRPHLIRKGGGSREVGDGTVVVGDRALAIQVKSRQAASDSIEREHRWLEKHVRAGGSQASGTIRTLRRQPVSLKNLRGRAVEVDGSKLQWLRVVVVEHPDSLRYEVDSDREADDPLVVLTRRDWEFLLDQLRSLTHVVDYLFRVCDDASHLVGGEPARYFELARLDADATSAGPAEWTQQFDGSAGSANPRLPLTPASRENSIGHVVFRIVLEDIADSPWNHDEADRLRLLALLDRFPVADRANLGQLLLERLRDAMSVSDGVKWQFRRVLLDEGRLQLAFGVATRRDEQVEEAFKQWGMLRHHEFAASQSESDRHELRTVAVLLTPCFTGLRYWDTTTMAILGDLGLEPDEVAQFRRLWNDPPAA